MSTVSKFNEASEEQRGKGKDFLSYRRVTGYITPDLSTWNPAKASELNDRVQHA